MYIQPTPTTPTHIARTIASECLSLRVRRLDRKVTRIYDQALRPHKITSAQLNLLVMITASGPIASAKLAKAMDLEKSSLSRNVARMTKCGWVRAEPGEDRGFGLSATKRGMKLPVRTRPAWDRAQAEARRVVGRRLVAELARAMAM